MFGTKKKIQEAENYAITATKEMYRREALNYFNIQVEHMNGSGALAWLRGGLELAQEIGILSSKEVAQIDRVGSARYEANQKAIREEKERIVAERKAERAAKAKAAKGE